MTSLLERLRQIIAEQLGVDEESITLSSSFVDDLNVEPSDLAELITAVEQEFSTPKRKLQIHDDDIKRIVTVQDLIECLRDYGIEG
jgi:acyl carrier protein